MATQQDAGPDHDTTESSSNGETTSNRRSAGSESAATPNKPNKLKQLWQKLDLDVPTVMMMFKASLPPTIAIAMYQSDAVAGVYQTLGYLVAITSVIGMCIMPRAQFIQTMSLNVLAVCVGAAVNLLALYSGIQARLNTTPAGASPTGYNSSASAVLAVWLFFQTFLVNVLRIALPQFQFPVIIYSIFSIVSLTYGTQFPSMDSALSFMERLIKAFLTGFGLATAVSFIVIPVSCRKVVFKEMAGYLNGLGSLLDLQAANLASLEEWEPEADTFSPDSDKHSDKKSKGKPGTNLSLVTAQGEKLKTTLQKIYGLHTKLPTDIKFAKREIAFGKLESKHIGEIWKRMRFILISIVGLSAVLDILQRRAEKSGWQKDDTSNLGKKAKRKQIDDLHQLMKTLHEPVAFMSTALKAAFQHVLLTLELVKPPKGQKKQNDEEIASLEPIPGTPGFAQGFHKQLDRFYAYKTQTLEEWCHQHDLEIPPGFFESTFTRPEQYDTHFEHVREKDQRQLFFGLYVHHLLWKAGQATLDLVLYADQLNQEGAMKKNRFILPRAKAFKKWMRAAFGREDYHDEDLLTADLSTGLDLGESFGKMKDPEHLPPRNKWEKIGEVIRLIPRALRSDPAAFGFRVACATMSVAIICYLADTQTFFLQNRLLWAMIMIPISMTRTAGQSTWSFGLRIAGTAIAMVASYIIYYIVDGRTPGVIVFLWLWLFLAFYIVLKQKTLLMAGIIAIVTSILIIGYELQTEVLGRETVESNGQPAYPTYVLAPYRLATVCGGLFVAFFWTVFPYPVSESTELRKDVGAALYMLANLSSVVHELVRARVQKIDGDENVKGTRAFHLEKARNIVFTKTLALLTTLQQNSAFSKVQIRVGGRFPHEEYTGLIESIQRVLQYTSLIAYASRTFSATEQDSEWATDFRKLLGGVDATSHQLTSLLSLLSSSIAEGRALPPYLEIPQHARYVKNLEAIDRDILSVRHIAEPEYSAFAVIQICAQCINDDVTKITRHVKTLVGVIDFSFHVKDRESEDVSSIDTVAEKKE